MDFSKLLNNYIEILNCSSKDLADVSGISPATISRYRNGERLPNFGSKQLDNLINGIVKIASEKNTSNINVKTVKADFSDVFGKNAIDFEVVRSNLNKLTSKLNINISKMAKSLGFDASYISRICSGQRKPSNIEEFVDLVCSYVIKEYSDVKFKQIVADLISLDFDEIQDDDSYYNELQEWFFYKKEDSLSSDSVDSFLSKLDEFNLEEYIKAIKFDEIKVPTMPFQIKSSKNYYGIEQMREGELDFFKHTVLSKTKKPIFMYNDMPMQDMAEDIDFGKKWMFAIACSLKKGLHLNMIHNLDRPFNELMLGLESFIPIYMTGQISPYYFESPTANLFNHTLYCSEVCALSGEGLSKYHNKAKYYLTSKKDELKFYKTFSSDLLSQALPLMKIYTKENFAEFEKFIEKEKNNNYKIVELENKHLNKAFKNISFTVCEDKWVMVKKNKSPEIRFVIHHPILRDAIENFVVPVEE